MQRDKMEEYKMKIGILLLCNVMTVYSAHNMNISGTGQSFSHYESKAVNILASMKKKLR